MSKRVLQPWRCGRGHILGTIQFDDGGKPLLMLYRHAVDPKAENPAEVDVMGLLTGGMRELRCDVCGGVRVWYERRRNAPLSAVPTSPHREE